ncbi:MAG: hypothetical protein ACRAVC_02405 [Trichormus sp.]
MVKIIGDWGLEEQGAGSRGQGAGETGETRETRKYKRFNLNAQCPMPQNFLILNFEF